MGIGLNWWFEEHDFVKTTTCVYPTRVVSDCPKNVQNPDLFPTPQDA